MGNRILVALYCSRVGVVEVVCVTLFLFSPKVLSLINYNANDRSFLYVKGGKTPTNLLTALFLKLIIYWQYSRTVIYD